MENHHDTLTGNAPPSVLTRLGEQALAFVQSRTAEHWIMFLAGLVVGLILG